MTLRRAHGAGRDALVRVETPPADEMGVAAPVAAPSGPLPRLPDGRWTPAGARLAGRQGGQARAERLRTATALADQLGLAAVPPELAPYLDAAKDYAETELRAMADMHGGTLGPGPSAMVQSAALALAASRAAYASGDAARGARLADQSRQARLTAHHLAELEAKARPVVHAPIRLRTRAEAGLE